MKLDWLFRTGTLLAAATVIGGSAIGAGLDQNAPKSTLAEAATAQQGRSFSEQTLAEILPGHTTKAQVESLLGKPWRETELDEEDVYPGDPSVEVWEYRGRDLHGTYRVHIEFDKSDVTTLIASIPDKAPRAVARVANPAADPAKQ